MSSEHLNTKAFAVFAVMLMMVAPLYITMDNGDEVEETDAVVPLPVVLLVISAIANAFLTTYIIIDSMEEGNGTTDDATRIAESKIVSQGMMIGMEYFENAMANIDTIWGLTEEHWIRQSELIASTDWRIGSSFDANKTLDEAKVYSNTGMLIHNACAQVNAEFDYLDQRRALWAEHSTYRDKMDMVLALDDVLMSSGSNYDLQMGLVVRNANAGDQVYIMGGEIFCSEDTTIVSDSGVSIHLNGGNGWVNLDDIAAFEPGIYTLEAGKSYAGNFSPIVSINSANLKAGMVASIGAECKVITYESNSLLFDGSDYYGSVQIGVKADGQSPELTPMTGAFVNFNKMLNTIRMTMGKAAVAGEAVWSIFDDAGESSSYITTLVVPEVYRNAQLNPAQTKLITALAMQYAYNYYKEHGDSLVKGGLQLTSGSLQLFCRGDISMKNGELYEDVIFTPIFYRDTTLSVGSYTTNQVGYIAIWDKASSLSEWTGQSSEYAGLVCVGGYTENAESVTFNIKEMKYDGNMIASIDLIVNEVDQIDPVPTPSPEPLPPVPYNKMTDTVKVVLIVIGVIIAMLGAYMRNPIAIVVGGIIILLGVFFCGAIADLLDWFGINDWTD